MNDPVAGNVVPVSRLSDLTASRIFSPIVRGQERATRSETISDTNKRSEPVVCETSRKADYTNVCETWLFPQTCCSIHCTSALRVIYSLSVWQSVVLGREVHASQDTRIEKIRQYTRLRRYHRGKQAPEMVNGSPHHTRSVRLDDTSICTRSPAILPNFCHTTV